jgi:wyosine [tRNA(Phe)-imidazoG37] synthetase (radical SAM superfamily)
MIGVSPYNHINLRKLKNESPAITFGTVPSRRLGRSLGINNIPPKICSYACVYCQLGRTIKMRIERQAYYQPQQLFQEVCQKIEQLRNDGRSIDYLTFVPDGEPTLDINLGKEIELLKELEIPIAVITNSSLIWREDVQEELLKADWVSLKIDTVMESTWHKIDRSHRTLHLEDVLNGIKSFSEKFAGTLVTETMLIHQINESHEELKKISNFLTQIDPTIAYLAIPTRPPAENYAVSPPEDKLIQAFQFLNKRLGRVEFLIGYEGNEFAFTGNVRNDILSITAVHPMREDAIDNLLKQSGSDWSVIRTMIREKEILEKSFEGEKFYLRKLNHHQKYQ